MKLFNFGFQCIDLCGRESDSIGTIGQPALGAIERAGGEIRREERDRGQADLFRGLHRPRAANDDLPFVPCNALRLAYQDGHDVMRRRPAPVAQTLSLRDEFVVDRRWAVQ